MPIIEMHMAEGRTTEQKSRVAAAVTEAVCQSLECAPETVRILITEHAGDEFYVAGITMAQRAAKRGQQA
ncbi:tautomerase family protein [Pseudomonas sp. N040]|uniref:tautomerase family protein n=1 Tax=Pseudomonas sp. N040 TaxID=2785325 RepID=UPI0018A24B9A|nr:tautomerase family protein [Pseudomonas sp. N040]MBF7729124.1 tautomerase family protein [Pseudomonas sp. N040]MBW7012764.1 tautomerase family protein [Pseudomonas sp. N040]